MVICGSCVGALARQSGKLDDSALQRRFFRKLPSMVFQQILAKELLKEPEVVRQYYPLSDDVLMILYWTPPQRRMLQRRWV